DPRPETTQVRGGCEGQKLLGRKRLNSSKKKNRATRKNGRPRAYEGHFRHFLPRNHAASQMKAHRRASRTAGRIGAPSPSMSSSETGASLTRGVGGSGFSSGAS